MAMLIFVVQMCTSQLTVTCQYWQQFVYILFRFILISSSYWCVMCYISPCGVLVPISTVHSNNDCLLEILIYEVAVGPAANSAN